MTHASIATTPSTGVGREQLQYTQEDYDFIEEITADDTPITYKPSPSLIPKHIRRLLADSYEAILLNEQYCYPWSTPVKDYEQNELTPWLDEVVMKIEGGESYMSHRDNYCMLSLALNKLGLQAPAFRPLPPIPWHADERTPEHMVLQRDRIVIDCHWLYCTKSKVYATEGVWRGIVNPKLTLQTGRIEKFAATKLRNESRADEILELKPFQQVQMAAMRGTKVHQAVKALRTAVTDSKGERTPAYFRRKTHKLQEWADSQPRFAKLYPKYRAYAMALELLENPTTKQVAQLAGLILGEPPLAASTAAQTLLKLKAIITGV